MHEGARGLGVGPGRSLPFGWVVMYLDLKEDAVDVVEEGDRPICRRGRGSFYK